MQLFPGQQVLVKVSFPVILAVLDSTSLSSSWWGSRRERKPAKSLCFVCLPITDRKYLLRLRSSSALFTGCECHIWWCTLHFGHFWYYRFLVSVPLGRAELVVRNRCQKPVKIGARLWPPEITRRTSLRPPMQQQSTHQRIRFESMPYFIVLYGYFVGKLAACFSKGSCRWAEFKKTGQVKVHINILYVLEWSHRCYPWQQTKILNPYRLIWNVFQWLSTVQLTLMVLCE